MVKVFLAIALWILALIRGCTPDYNPPSAPLGGSDSPDEPTKCDSRGAPVWYLDFNNQNLVIRDTPLWYETPFGDDIRFSLTYNLLADDSAQFHSGARWANTFNEFIAFDSESGNYTYHQGDGRTDVYSKSTTSGSYAIDSAFFMSREKAYTPGFSVEDGSFVSENRHITLTYPDGSKRVFTQHSDDQFGITQRVDQFGNTVTYAYEDNRVTAVTSSNGKQFTLSYDSDQQLTQVTDHTGRSASFEYDEMGNLVALTDMQGYRSEITYDDNHTVKSITDAKGTTQFIVEASSETADGRSTTYPAFGEPMGLSNRLTVVDPLGNKSEYYYESDSGEAWYVAPEHYVEYQSENINNAQSDVPKTVYTYKRYSEGYSRIASITQADGTWTKYTYDDNRNLSSISYSTGETYSFSNSENGLIQQVTDELGNITNYQFDARNNLTQIEDTAGVRKYTYNDVNQVITQLDNKGLTTQYEYNTQGQISAVINAKGERLNYNYSADSELESVAVGDQTLVTYTYDSAGRLLSEVNRFGQRIAYDYDNINQVKRISQPGGRDISIEFGSCPRIVNKVTYPGEREYNYGYDAAKRLETILDPMQGQFKIIRDGSGRIIGLIDANQNKTSFVYNAAGRLIEKTYADGSQVKTSYQSSGLLHQKTNARGISKTYSYSDKGQLTKITYSDGTPSVVLGYDEQGRLSQIDDAAGSTLYHYAATGELVTIDGPFSNDAIDFTYDELYRVSTISVDGSVNSRYEYDSLGRAVKITAQGQVFDYSYQDSGTYGSVVGHYPNGITQTVELDNIGDLSSLVYQKSAEQLAKFGYDFDVAGDLVGLQTTEPMPAESNSYRATYNNVNQIATYNGVADVFDYDADGNLIAGVLAGGETFSASYDAENRLTSMLFTQDGVQIEERFTYNYRHQLVEYSRLENGAVVAEKKFVRLGLLELQERDGSDTVVAENSWRLDKPGGIGGLLLRTAGEQSYTYVTNHLGHVTAVYNQNGDKVESHHYSLYGTASGDSFSQQPFGFSTKRNDFASGLVYFGYRFYAPHLGRWLNRDPLQEAGGINLYAYVKGDPLGYVDPDGRNPFIIGLVVGGINGGLGAWVQGGTFDDIAEGVFWGAWAGLISPAAGSAFSAALANGMGQLHALDRQGKSYSCFNIGSALGAAFGSGYAAHLTRYPGAAFLGAQLDFGFSATGSILGGKTGD